MSTAELVNHRPARKWALSAVAILVSIVVFIVPFAFIVLTAVKDRTQSADLSFSWPHQFRLVQNFVEVVK
ncbi:MAG: carbohydrate ABC transporter permease, partial [Kribbellaceae bacterium]|nr:carbohydrate ABC transporter permease [Kribbellaceae bacterium]